MQVWKDNIVYGVQYGRARQGTGAGPYDSVVKVGVTALAGVGARSRLASGLGPCHLDWMMVRQQFCAKKMQNSDVIFFGLYLKRILSQQTSYVPTECHYILYLCLSG